MKLVGSHFVGLVVRFAAAAAAQAADPPARTAVGPESQHRSEWGCVMSHWLPLIIALSILGGMLHVAFFR